MKQKSLCWVSGCGVCLATVLVSAWCFAEETVEDRIGKIRALAEKPSASGIAEIGTIFLNEPLKLGKATGALLKVEAVNLLGKLAEEDDAAALELVRISRVFLPEATQSVYYAKSYALSDEYLFTTSALFSRLEEVAHPSAETFLEEVVDNRENAYEQYATMQAALVKLGKQCRELPIDRQVALLVPHLKDGIKDRTDYVKPGIRSKSSTLDLAAMDRLVQLGPACLSHLNGAYHALPASVKNQAKRTSILYALARILATHESGKETAGKASAGLVEAYLKSNYGKGPPELGSAHWYIEQAAVKIPSIKDEVLHTSRKPLSEEEQAANVVKIQQAVAEARKAEMARRMGEMNTPTQKAFQYVLDLPKHRVSPSMDQLLRYIKASNNQELDKLVIRKMRELAIRDPANSAWTQDRVTLLLDIAPSKSPIVYGMIGGLINRITTPGAEAACATHLGSKDPIVQFTALLGIQSKDKRKHLKAVAALSDSQDADVRMLSARTLSQAGISVIGKSKTEILEQVRSGPAPEK